VASRRHTLDPELTILGGRDFVGLVGRLCREQNWEALTALFGAVGASEQEVVYVSLTDLDTASRVLIDTLAGLGPGSRPNKRPTPYRPADEEEEDELAAVRIAAAEALSARCSRPPLTELERRALGRAAALLGAAGDHRRAALAYEDLGEETRAAHAWGALGDLDRMEAALARDEQRSNIRRAAVDAVRRFEALLTGGERRAAVAEAALLMAAGVQEAGTANARATRIASDLIGGRGISLRVPGGPWLRVALLPACIGRDRGVEVPLRDPSVSRRHALLRAGDDGITIEDAGSRGGVRIGGARVGAPLPLRGAGELGLGSGTTLRFTADDRSVMLEGSGGLDRSLRALVGADSVPLAPLFPGAEGLSLVFAGGARLTRSPDVTVRVDGKFIGPGCDLLHGDVIETTGRANVAPLRLEIE
jgi:hypothetical protein